MPAFHSIFTNPSLPIRLEPERPRIIVFRRFMVLIFLVFTVGLVLHLIFGFRNFSVWTFITAQLLTLLFLVFSMLDVKHGYLLTVYFITLIAVNQVNFIVSPKGFHVLVYWMGLTPLYMSVLTKPSKIIFWTSLLMVTMIGNGLWINQNPGPYEVAIRPISFIVGGVFFTLTTISVAVFFSHTEKRMRERVYEKNFQLEELTRKVEEKNQQLRNYNDHLEDRVLERTEELEKQNDQLAEYAFINSHLVRGPLARILGITALISRTTTSAEQKDLIEHLNKASGELDTVVSNINQALDNDGKIDRKALEKLRDH